MQISEFQRWVRGVDQCTQWSLLTTPQLMSHLTEDVGEVARCINRLCEDRDNREDLLANLAAELVDAFWFLVKLAIKFDVDLDSAARAFVGCAEERPAGIAAEHRQELISGLSNLDKELAAARTELPL